ncbi:MAG: FAD:protein FMN transferase [FCB group bacterium]|nr:FAD:protein FMN transferase [FCB group bacterium]
MINSVKKRHPQYRLYAQFRLGIFFLLLLFVGCTRKPPEIVLTGQTMGTTYTVKVLPGDLPVNSESLQAGIDSVLVEINRQMSTYSEQSEISRFNRSRDLAPFPVSSAFAAVVQRALEISALTKGAFDITVMPLVDLWGFGPHHSADDQIWSPPKASEIEIMLRKIGFDKLSVADGTIQKAIPGLQLDVNAIAKGYGVDAVANYLMDRGFNRFLVEIGGEVRGLGENQKGEPWLIGIDQPRLGSFPGADIRATVLLENNALATSGDYRNYFEYQGELYSHAIDPRTGYPTQSKVASATVMAPTCMDADALATALMILGEEEGLKLIESLPEVEALIIIRERDGQFRQRVSSGMKLNK